MFNVGVGYYFGPVLCDDGTIRTIFIESKRHGRPKYVYVLLAQRQHLNIKFTEHTTSINRSTVFSFFFATLLADTALEENSFSF